ncbi:hypothetical protein ACIOWM_05235 [Streptomyces anulatus]
MAGSASSIAAASRLRTTAVSSAVRFGSADRSSSPGSAASARPSAA